MAWIDRLRHFAARLKTDVVALWFAARDPATPLAAKLVAGAVAAYALSPIDLIPDVIPVIGYLDDLILVPLGIALAVRLVPLAQMAIARQRAAESLARPVSRIAAAVIIAAWLATAAIIAALWR